MLQLKRVELQGFKSFCDRTELRFHGEGIAAIVGPNGCGKSNLSDAISWVLGEQSAKSLRGARMEDVIFAGTRERKPVGMASVTMVLVDPEVVKAAHEPVAVLPAEGAPGTNGQNGHANGIGGQKHAAALPASARKPGEVTITRRLFRSGESEYLIDGRQARLRDIQDLFMGSGLGPESYAIIEQGRIGQILSSKPQDRRAVIEEAAGITKYKARKRLAEAKLESAKQNLTRVFDILEEVTRQANSLKRQAAKAKRYGELKQEMEGRLRTLLAGRYRALEAEKTRIAIDLERASTELKEAGETAAAGEAAKERLQAVCYELESKLTETRLQLADASVEAERTRGRLESQVRESGAIEQRIGRAEVESREIENRLAQSQTERDGLHQSVGALEAQIASARAELAEKNQARDRLQAELREREKSIEAMRLAVLRLLGEASTLRNQLAQIDEYLSGIERETVRSQKEEQAAALEIDRLTEVRRGLSERMSRRQLELASVTTDRKRTEEDLAERKRAAAGLRARIDQLRAETSKLKAQKESLENILLHHSYSTDTVKRLFSAVERGQAGDFKPHGVLADFVEVDPAFERQAEEFLHDELEYVVVEDWAQARSGLDLLRHAVEGRATFLVESQSAGEPPTSEAPRPELPKLTDHLRLTNGLDGRITELLPRLANCYLAAEAESARALALECPELFFLVPEGGCYQGASLTGGKKKASGPLALKRELRESSKALEQQTRELNSETAAFEALSAEISALEAELERLRNLQQTQEKDALAIDHDLRKLSEETSRTNSRISIARLDLERLGRERERAEEQRRRNLEAVEERERERREREAALESARQESEGVEAEAAKIREQHSALRAELAGLEERHRAERSAFARLENQIREMTARRVDLGAEISRLGEHRSRLLAENIDLDKKSAELSERILRIETSVAELSALEAARREELRAAEEELKELRVRIEAGHHRRSEIEVELVRRESELKFLDETSRKELNTPITEISSEESPDAGALAEIERLYLEVKNRIDALGPINSNALEEFEEAQQRQEFLTVQRQDLIDSIADTEKAIHEIDSVTRKRFGEAFEAINANFRRTFQTLFGGGSGEMRLTDDTNAAECGIDIIASPPGKKLQNVLLLSGGEKALAALSLLMAIFDYQPSPFCVLDEVDAPLDEANIGRLMRLLKEMSAETQFIIITHSKRTMETAQILYGVTMQEAGVSKLVSVKFEPAAPQLEAIPA